MEPSSFSHYSVCNSRENKKRSVRKRLTSKNYFFLKNNNFIINPKINIHTMTSPNNIIAPAPTTLVVTTTTTNNIISINAKIVNKIIIFPP